MASNPMISVVMPAYNARGYIALAIESVLNQTFQGFEFIIIEDPSSDDTNEIIEGYREHDPRIQHILNNPNLGLTASLNKGIDISHGEFIARMDADDISYPDRFEKQVSYLRQNPDVCLIATSFERIDEEGNVISRNSLKPGKDGLKKMMEITNSVVHGSVMFRREKVLALGKYREGIRYAEDYDLWLRIMERYDIDILPDILYKFRLTHQSRSIAEGEQDKYYYDLVKRFAEERKNTGKDSYKDITASSKSVETSYSKKNEMYHLYRGLELLSANKKKEARRDFSECLKLNPTRILYWLLFAAALAPLPILNIARWFWRKSPRDIH